MRVSEAFGLLENEKLIISKGNNTKGTINASVQKNIIFTHCVDIPIEKDDILLRKLSNGMEELYKVINPVYYNGFESMPPHYELEVSKIGLDDDKQNSTYNINANKVNINSIDNSYNINNDSKIFDEMLEIIKNNNVDNKNEIISAINQMKVNTGKPSFKNTVINFMQIASNCIALFKEFIPLLLT